MIVLVLFVLLTKVKVAVPEAVATEGRAIGGWIHTYCTPCEEARELARKQYDEKEAE